MTTPRALNLRQHEARWLAEHGEVAAIQILGKHEIREHAERGGDR